MRHITEAKNRENKSTFCNRKNQEDKHQMTDEKTIYTFVSAVVVVAFSWGPEKLLEKQRKNSRRL